MLEGEEQSEQLQEIARFFAMTSFFVPSQTTACRPPLVLELYLHESPVTVWLESHRVSLLHPPWGSQLLVTQVER